MWGSQKLPLSAWVGAGLGEGGAGRGEGRAILLFSQNMEAHVANIPAAFGFPFLSVLRLN